jgi:hypothetical protein
MNTEPRGDHELTVHIVKPARRQKPRRQGGRPTLELRCSCGRTVAPLPDGVHIDLLTLHGRAHLADAERAYAAG